MVAEVAGRGPQEAHAGVGVPDRVGLERPTALAVDALGVDEGLDAALELGVPASAAAGNYVATITLTLA